MGWHRLPKIALYGELSTGYCDRGVPKKRFKDSLKKTLGTCHIDHQQWSTLLTVRPGAAPSIRSSPSLRTPAKPTSERNAAGGRSREPQQPYQIKPLIAVAAAGFACPAEAYSAISVPAVNVDSLLHKSSFAKSNQEEYIRNANRKSARKSTKKKRSNHELFKSVTEPRLE